MAEFTPSLEHQLHQFLAREDYTPLKQHELARALRLEGSHRTRLRRVLKDMERNGRVVRLRKNRWALPRAGKELVGRLRVHPRGFAFLVPETAGEEEVYVPAKGLGTALHGDTVVVSVTSSPEKRPRKGAEAWAANRKQGRVDRVIARGSPDVVGHLLKTAYYWYVVPDNPRILQDIRAREFRAGFGHPNEHHKVTIRLDLWEEPWRPLSGVVMEDLGPADDPAVDVLCVIRSHHLETEFSPEAEAEAARWSPTPPAEALAGREDLRGTLTFTIDPENARDYDDAVSLGRAADGHWELGVHIADVACCVPEGSALDREAFIRGNSVYLVDRVLPMLPPHLTTEVCSLQPGRDRLTHTALLEVDPRGNVVRHRTFPSVIRSAARLTYDQVQSLFEGGDGASIPGPVRTSLESMRELARILRQKRVREGSLEFNLPEVECILDPRGHAVEIRKRMSKEANHLIEEFMLLANRAVASMFAQRSLPAIYRIHEPPEIAQWEQMAEELSAFGIDVSPERPNDLNAIAASVLGKPLEYPVNLTILRNLKRAEYSTRLAGHFGLAFDRYTHFTSPIRRYPDLVVHRLLRALEEGRPGPCSRAEAARIAAHCSETEREADAAEAESVEIKRIRYYEAKLLNGEQGPFQGVVVSIVSRGLIVELADTLQKGLLPFSSLDGDYYAINKTRNRAVGRRRNATWQLGTPVVVEVVRVDPARRYVDFRPAQEETAPRRGRRKRVSGRGR